MILLFDKPKAPTLKERIDSMLCSLLGSSSPRGKHYLATVVYLYMTEYKDRKTNMRVLFERVADEQNIAPKSVATAISRYINNNWYSGNTKRQDEVFGNTLSFRKPTPTVSKFVTTVSLELAFAEATERK